MLFYIGTAGIGAIVVFALSCDAKFVARSRGHVDGILLRFAAARSDILVRGQALPKIAERPGRDPLNCSTGSPALTIQMSEGIPPAEGLAAASPLRWQDYLNEDGTVRWGCIRFEDESQNRKLEDKYRNASAVEIVGDEIFLDFYLTSTRCGGGSLVGRNRRILAENLFLAPHCGRRSRKINRH
ncbi:MAG: hypothetical protein LBF24_00270 [Puniceicoccales bacterium]|nr:hypothetical protein [Puniceicoccales bacterium]